jgi:hypothetical protein
MTVLLAIDPFLCFLSSAEGAWQRWQAHMATDWLSTLKERSDLAARTAQALPDFLADPRHGVEDVEHLYDVVGKCAQEMERLKGRLRKAKVDAEVRESASSLKAVWDEIGEMVSDRLATLQRQR